jgi:hypothetical protein
MKKLCTLFLALALSLGLAVPAWAATFSDVSETHWARPFVDEVSEAGIMKGTGNGQFSPDGTMTAAEFAAMLARAFWPEALEANTAQAPAGSPWWLGPVQTIYQQGGFKSTSIDTDFSAAEAGGTKVTSPLSRYDMAGMLYDVLRAKGLPLGTERDAEINKSYLSDWEQVPAEYGDAVAYVMATGVLTGKSGNRFAGADTMSRGEAAAAMSRLLAYSAAHS